jgi:hypothetical protein
MTDLPEPGMQEINPYLDLGPLDPHKGTRLLRWWSESQMREYAVAARLAALEEAAQVAEQCFIPGHSVAGPHFAANTAAAIRALKEKP